MRLKAVVSKLNIQYQLMILFTIVFVVPFIIFGLLSYQNYENILQKRTFLYNEETTVHMSNTIDEFFINLEKTARTIANDENLQSKIGKEEWEYDKKIDYIKDNEEIYGELSNILIQKKELSSVYLYTVNRIAYHVNFDDNIDFNYKPYDEQWFINAFNNQSFTLLKPRLDKQTSSKKVKVIPFICTIKDKYDRISALLQFNINPSIFYSSFGRYETDERDVYIVDEKGGILYSNRNNRISDKLNNNIWDEVKKGNNQNFIVGNKVTGQKLVSYTTSQYTNWTIVFSTNNKALIKDTQSIKMFLFVFIIFITLILVLMSMLIAKNLSKPVLKLGEITNKINASQSEFDYQIDNNEKMGLLNEHYNQLILTINNMLKKISYYNKKEKEQEIKILQAQINPHFIYNTLNAIKMLANMQHADEIANALKAFINLLRSSIKIGTTYISIEEEINQIKDYIAIQQLRYYENFHVIYEIDESVKKYKTLKFLLQPIVENAIFHGLDFEDRKGLLQISIKKIGNIIRYSIKDNGTGIDNKEINMLLEKKGEDESLNRIGLYNVNQRIKMNFGKEFGVNIKSSSGAGTEVGIIIPAILFEDEEEGKNA